MTAPDDYIRKQLENVEKAEQLVKEIQARLANARKKIQTNAENSSGYYGHMVWEACSNLEEALNTLPEE